MSSIATAVVATAVIGGVASNKAAKQQASSAKEGLKQSNQLASQSRMTAIDLYNRGSQAKNAGQLGAFNFYKQAAPSRMQPFVQGNLGAQRVIGQGATQTNNAILGLPVDMSFANNPQQISYNLDYLSGAQMPERPAAYIDPELRANNNPEISANVAEKATSGARRLLGRVM